MFSRLYCQEALKNVHVAGPKSAARFFVFAKKPMVKRRRVGLVNTNRCFAIALRAVGRVVTRGDTRDKHSRLATAVGAGGERGEGDDQGEKQFFHVGLGV